MPATLRTSHNSQSQNILNITQNSEEDWFVPYRNEMLWKKIMKKDGPEKMNPRLDAHRHPTSTH